MTSTASTTARLLRLLSLLQTRRDWPGTVLAYRLEITSRTVRRDVDRLRDLGYSIHATMGPDGGYRLDAGSELPPLLFDDEQALAVAIALQTAPSSGAGIEEAALRALTTVRQVMPSRLRHRLDSLRFSTLPRSAEGPDVAPVAPEVLVTLSAAVRAREVLRFDYASGASRSEAAVSAAPLPRHVEPHAVVFAHGRWYLVGWDLGRSDWRIFRADRITPRIPNGPRFNPREIPGGGDVGSYVAARFKGSDGEDAWPCRGTVILGMPASEVLPFVGDGLVEDLGADRCSLELGSWSWGALAASFGRFEASMQVVGPPELREAFGELARKYEAATRGH
jgi:predicted DNA-binding transcriptional regulator YafY